MAKAQATPLIPFQIPIPCPWYRWKMSQTTRLQSQMTRFWGSTPGSWSSRSLIKCNATVTYKRSSSERTPQGSTSLTIQVVRICLRVAVCRCRIHRWEVSQWAWSPRLVVTHSRGASHSTPARFSNRCSSSLHKASSSVKVMEPLDPSWGSQWVPMTCRTKTTCKMGMNNRLMEAKVTSRTRDHSKEAKVV